METIHLWPTMVHWSYFIRYHPLDPMSTWDRLRWSLTKSHPFPALALAIFSVSSQQQKHQIPFEKSDPIKFRLMFWGVTRLKKPRLDVRKYGCTKKCNMQTVYAYIIYVYISCIHSTLAMHVSFYLSPVAYLPINLPCIIQGKSQSSLPSLSSSTTTNLDDSTQAEVCLVVRQARGTMMLPVAAWGHQFLMHVAVLYTPATKGEMNTPDIKTWRCKWLWALNHWPISKQWMYLKNRDGQYTWHLSMLRPTNETVSLVFLMTTGCPPPRETHVEQDPGYRTLF